MGKGKAKGEVTAQTVRTRLGHIHDFIMARFCQIDVGRKFLYSIEDQLKREESPRLMSLAELVADQVFLEAAKLLDRDTRALSLHTLTEGVYLDLIGDMRARERLRSLVKEASVEKESRSSHSGTSGWRIRKRTGRCYSVTGRCSILRRRLC